MADWRPTEETRAACRGGQPGGEEGKDPSGAQGDGEADDVTKTVGADGGYSPGRQPAPDFREGDKIDRFLVLGRLGAGGMGQVYEAYDPQLHRRVAIKLLYGKAAEQNAQPMLMREAQALARLSHPNVIQVYEVGAIDDKVFLAMEHVDGADMRVWLKEESRTWQEIVEVFLQAGRGLAAAHEADLIHRDFKPANVLMDAKGRVRVVDFGLARAAQIAPAEAGQTADGDDEPEAPDAKEEPEAPDAADELEHPNASDELDSADARSSLSATGSLYPSALESPLTRAGATLGTPLFMAPEQRYGAATARSDQFSYCVSLYRALYDRYPFSKRHLGLAKQPPPAKERPRPVPEWIAPIVMRGLAPNAAERFCSMEALLAELDRKPAKRPVALWTAVGVAVAAVFASLGVVRMHAADRGLCRGAEAELAEVWNDEVKVAIGRAFTATMRAHARDTHERIAKTLDRYGNGWMIAHTDACEATHLRGTQSSELLDLRIGCLDRRRGALAALVTVLASADGRVVDKAVEAAHGLPPVAGCNDSAALRAAMPLPEEPRVRALVLDLRTQLQRAAALRAAGKWKESLSIAQRVAKLAEEPSYPPLLADSHYLVGLLHHGTGIYAEAMQSYYVAARAAAAARDDRLLARTWIGSVVTSVQSADYARAAALSEVARAAVERIDKNAFVDADLHTALGHYHRARGAVAEAAKHYRMALARLEGDSGDSVRVQGVLYGLANALAALGRKSEAREYRGRILESQERLLGSGHPQLAKTLDAFGASLAEDGLYEQSLEYHRRALAIWEKSGHHHATYAHNNAAATLMDMGRFDEAMTHYNAAVDIATAQLGASHADTAYWRAQRGHLKNRRGDYDQAMVECKEARAIQVKALPPDHAELMDPLLCIGEAHFGLGDRRRAAKALRSAVALAGDGSAKDPIVAKAQFLLARAIQHTGGRQREALTLADAARNAYAGAGSSYQDELARVEAWIAERRGRR